VFLLIQRSGYVAEHLNLVTQRYRSEHSARMRQLSRVGSRFRPLSIQYAGHMKYVVVIFGLNVDDVFDSFKGVQTTIKEIKDRTAVQLHKRNCKTLAASVVRYHGRAGKVKPELKYYLLAYCCVFGENPQDKEHW